MVTRADILKPIELKTETVDIVGIGQCRFRQLSQSQAAKWQSWLMPKGKRDKTRTDRHRLKLVQLCLVDENDAPLLEEADIEALEEQPANVVQELIYASMVVNGFIEGGDLDLLGESES